MKEQRIIWTLLPKGRDTDKAYLSAFISPRLMSDEKAQGLGYPVLSGFSDWENWAAIAKNLAFRLRFSNGSVIDATATSRSEINEQLWLDLFPSNSFVREFKFPTYLTLQPIVSYPVYEVYDDIKAIYSGVGGKSLNKKPVFSSPDPKENNKEYQEFLKPLEKLTTDKGTEDLNRKFSSKMNSQLNVKGTQASSLNKQFRSFDKTKTSEYGFTSETEKNFFLLNRYYNRAKSIKDISKGGNISYKPVPKRLPEPKIDFHEVIAGLSDFPKLMRMLGIVIDLEIPISSVPSSATWVQIESVWGRRPANPINRDTFCKTAISLSGNDFQAATNPELGSKTDVQNGMLKLNDENLFKIVGLDVDGAGLKIIQLARTLLPFSNIPNKPEMYATNDDFALNQANINGIVKGPPSKYYLQDLGEEKEQPLPALRSNGITLTKQERARYVEAMIDRMALANKTAIENNQPPLFYAEDLLRGYRVDVKDTSDGSWKSLCERVGKYNIGNNSFELIDEGYLKSASMSREVADSNTNISDQDTYLHEAVFTWFGWSLVADKPGKTITQNTYDSSGNPLKTPREEVRHTDESKPETEFGIITKFKPKPGSLPKLRFGNTYRFRIRTVDLAGNSLASTTQNDSNASAPIVYNRFEPVSSPVIMPRKAFTEGESLEVMVIRSNHDKSAFDYYNQAYIKDITNKKYYESYFHENDRHVVPPKSAQNMAEHHKAFDSAMGLNKNYERWYKIALKEEGQLSDIKITDIDSGEKSIDVSSDVKIITPPNTPLPHAKLPLAAGEPLGQGQYIVNNAEQLILPYLPDIAKGAAFRRLPSASVGSGYIQSEVVPETNGEIITKVPFDANFPDALPFKIRIIEGNGSPQWDSRTRTLIVKLPKAMATKVDFSCYISPQDAEGMGIIDWLPSNKKALAKTLATIGATWLITPWRSLSLVHAVQQPLIAPRFTTLTGSKNELGQTHAILDGKFELNVASTGQVDFIADWKDPNDDPANKNYTGGESDKDFIFNKGHIGDLKINTKDYPANRVENPEVMDLLKPLQSKSDPEANATETTNTDTIIHGDSRDTSTKNGSTKGSVIRKKQDEGGVSEGLASHDWIGLETLQSVYKGLNKQFLVPLNFDNLFFKHDFGDTKYHKVNYKIKGTTRFREYFPQEIWGDPINEPINDHITSGDALKKRIHRIGENFEVKVLNSARPDAPKVLYVVPTFGWDRPADGAPSSIPGQPPADIISRRCGGGLRVYLERPWFSSGDEELLAVVLAEGYTSSSSLKDIKNTGGKNITDALKPLVTQWGNDPIWSSETLKGVTPDATDFPLSVKTMSGLSIPDIGNYKFTAVGHKPEYDKSRGLWYCDIDIDMGDTYYPFVRLALARFQPNSIENAHLSSVVLSDFAQLAPSRVAAVSFTDLNKFKIVISGTYGTNLYTELGKGFSVGIKADKTVGKGLVYSRVMLATVEKKTGANTWVPVGDEFANVIVPPYKEVDKTMIWLAQIDLSGKQKTSVVKNNAKTSDLSDAKNTKPEDVLKDFNASSATVVDQTVPLRVSIREYEFYEADSADSISKTVHGVNEKLKLRSRIVYADIIRIR